MKHFGQLFLLDLMVSKRAIAKNTRLCFVRCKNNTYE